MARWPGRLGEFESRGILRAAEEVDPRGAADLVRYAAANSIPRYEVPLDGFRDADDFRDWFARLRKR